MSSNADTILHQLKSKGPQTAADLADRLGVTAVAVRQHMAALRDDGLVAFDDRKQGVGRPRRTWHLTAAGHGRFPNGHEELVVDLLAAVQAEFGAPGLDALIARREQDSLRAYRKQLAGAKTVKEKLAALVAARSREGYMAGWTREGKGRYLLVEDHCPICAAAATCQGLCRSELDQFRALFAGLAEVDRVEHVLAGARRCAYRITSVKASGKTGKGRKTKKKPGRKRD